MNKIPTDVIYIISSFLLPRDLIRFRTLSKQYSTILLTYFLRKFKTTFLAELICPLCGNDWISNKYISPNDFADIDEDLHYFEVIQRHKFISEIFNKHKRDHLLCEECEDTLQETPYLTRYKLPHNYQVYIDFDNDYPWACLIKLNSNPVVWNQYNCVSDQSLEQNGGDDSDIDFEDENNYYLEWDRGHFV